MAKKAAKPAVTGVATNRQVGPWRLRDLAIATLDQAKLIVEFRQKEQDHRVWTEELEPTLPTRLRQPLAGLRENERAREEASFGHYKACRVAGGKGTPEVMRSSDAAKKRLKRATNRCKQAGAAANATQLARVRATTVIMTKWVRRQSRELEECLANYTSEFSPYADQLTGPDRSFGVWTAENACELLRDFVLDLVEQLKRAPLPDTTGGLERPYIDLGPDNWDGLRRDIRRDVDSLVQSTLVAGEVAQSWVPAVHLIRDDPPGLLDPTGVRRFCVRYKILTRKVGKSLEVDSVAFLAKVHEILKAGNEKSNVMDRIDATHERRRRENPPGSDSCQ